MTGGGDQNYEDNFIQPGQGDPSTLNNFQGESGYVPPTNEGSNVNTNSQPNMNGPYNVNNNPSFNQNMSNNSNQGFNQNMSNNSQGYNQNSNQGFNQNMSNNSNQGYNQNMNQGYNPNMNNPYNQNMNTNVNYNQNINMNQNMGYNTNPGYQNPNFNQGPTSPRGGDTNIVINTSPQPQRNIVVVADTGPEPNVCGNRIPILDSGTALVILIINIFFPGIGTMITGCIGNVDNCAGWFCIGVLQIALIFAFGIGWIWSIIVGVQIVSRAGARRREVEVL